MSPKPASQVRKVPRQLRAQETVEAILVAAAHILEREGFEAATTNRVAAKAGVSIGSLYQYFPNKESLARALNERHTRELRALLQRRFEEIWDAPIEEGVRAIVHAMVEAHRVDPGLHRVLVGLSPSVGGQAETHVLEAEVEQLLTRYLEARSRELRLADPRLSAFMLVHTVEALTHAAVLEHPQWLKGEGFVEETTAMIAGYLRGGSPGERSSRT